MPQCIQGVVRHADADEPMLYPFLRSLLFAVPSAEAHGMVMDGLRAFEALTPLHGAARAYFAAPESLRTTQMGLTFPSPIGLAGGFDKDARVPRTMAVLGFGFLELGTVTARAQEANPSPNMFRLPDDRAIVNRLGFPNDGATTVANRFRDCGPVGVPVAMSIGKSRAVPIDPIESVVEDYLASFRAVREVADFVIVNVSSPNTKGLRALQGPELARALLGAIVHENRTMGAAKPVLLKVSPDLSEPDLDALLDVVCEVKLEGVVASNTTLARTGLVSRKEVIAAAGDGGLSGPPVRARALQIVRKARATLGPDATIIGVGGIETGKDARAYLDAGANLVQLYTGLVYGGPLAPSRIARELAALR